MIVLISVYVVTIVLMLRTNKTPDTGITRRAHEYRYNNTIPQVAINP